MSTLVFLLDHDDLDLLGRQDLIRIAHDDAPEIVRAIEDVVALATGSAGGPVYCGLATLEAVAGPGLVPGELVAQLRKVQLYPNGEPCPPFPFGQRIQWVDQAGDGFGEEQQALFDVPTQHELFDISRLTMRRYHERCALSGIAMPVGELGSIPTAIRPNPPGAPLSITNFIALWPPLGSAFGAGHFTISSSYETIANLDLLDHRLREHLQPGLKLRLPDQEEDWPSQDHLAYHRRFVFKR